MSAPSIRRRNERRSRLRLKRHPIEKARIELIPMIDTMAFLLVFFMIASLAMTQQLGLTVSLPRASAATPQTSADQLLVVTADREARLFLNKQPVSWDSLEGALRARLQARAELVIVVNADADLAHGTVVRVMDAVRRAGATRLSIATQRPEGEGVGPDGSRRN
jgi:biopolymer transport protein ExbD